MFIKLKNLNTTRFPRKGRNHSGSITSFHRGGGTRCRYYFINFNPVLINDRSFKYCTHKFRYHSSDVSLYGSFTGFLSYSYADRVKEKFLDFSLLKLSPISNQSCFVSNYLPLRDLPLGSFVCNIERRPDGGGRICRSAGSFARLFSKKIVIGGIDQAGLLLKKKRLIYVPLDCRAFYGVLPNQKHRQLILRKAGVPRNRGRRPIVRGVAMNPHDHPHGGGENKSSGGRHNCTPWGKLTKGFKTIKRKRLLKYQLFCSKMNKIVG